MKTWVDGFKSALAVQLFLKYSQTANPVPWNYQPMDEKIKWIKDAQKITESLQEQCYVPKDNEL